MISRQAGTIYGAPNSLKPFPLLQYKYLNCFARLRSELHSALHRYLAFPFILASALSCVSGRCHLTSHICVGKAIDVPFCSLDLCQE